MSSTELNGFLTQGQFHTYGGGGYTVNFESDFHAGMTLEINGKKNLILKN